MDAERIEKAVIYLKPREIRSDTESKMIGELLDLAQSYLTALKSGVPEERKINQAYHHLCYGGGTCIMLDCWSDKRTITCKFSGDRNWATPYCECCNGKHEEKEKSIYNQEREQGFNICHSLMLAQIVKRDREIEELKKRLENYNQSFLDARNISEPCPRCSGLGVTAYGNTSTWRGGIGGSMMTSGICDKCWGSGDKNRPWVNLRNLRSAQGRIEELEAIAERVRDVEGIRKIIENKVPLYIMADDAGLEEDEMKELAQTISKWLEDGENDK